MSQKKVDEYKNYKKNRRENIKKEKRKERLTMAAMWGAVVVFIACVGGAMGVSIYNKYQAKQAALPTYGSTSFILSDMAGIQKEDQTQSETVNESEDASSVESSESESASDEAVASEEASNKETLTQTENEETESESAEK